MYHATNEALLESVEHKGVCASCHSHGTEGLWLSSLLTPWLYNWAWTPLQYFAGHVLHIKMPMSAASTYLADGTSLLQQNRHIRADSGYSHLRFVLQGKKNSSHLRCRVAGVFVRWPPKQYRLFAIGLRASIRNSVTWLLRGWYDPDSQRVPSRGVQPPWKFQMKIKCSGEHVGARHPTLIRWYGSLIVACALVPLATSGTMHRQEQYPTLS